MKYKVGDKVKYNSGDWWYFGTVSAVYEHAICPFYRLSVERMEKVNCKFAVSQFEFELEADKEAEVIKGKRKWENSEIEYLKKYYGVLKNEDLSNVLQRSWREIESMRKQVAPELKPKRKSKPEKIKLPKVKKEKTQRKITDIWVRNLELFQQGVRNNSIHAWAALNRKQFNSGKLTKEKEEKLNEINFSFDVVRQRTGRKKEKLPKIEEAPKSKNGEAWFRYLELYKNGEKSNLIYNWIALNRKRYHSGKLAEDKLAKLMEINFPFEVDTVKKVDAWDKKLAEWKRGERNSLQDWRQYNVKLYVDGKLSHDRIEKLKEVEILK